MPHDATGYYYPWGRTHRHTDTDRQTDRQRHTHIHTLRGQYQFIKTRHALATGRHAPGLKTQAITSMASPTYKEYLQRFLGMFTYLGKFIPNLSQVAAPLRALAEQIVSGSGIMNMKKASTS